MSDEDLLELDELVGEWADAASKDDVDEDLLALDTLADEWAKKEGALDLDGGAVSAASAPESEAAPDIKPEPAEVDEDWAGRKSAVMTGPPDPEEPITLPKRPDPVTMPPLPEGDFSNEAKQGDRRYASPMAPAAPIPPLPVASEGEPEAAAPEEPDEKDETSAGIIGAGALAGGAAIAATAGAARSRTDETAQAAPEPQPIPGPEPAPTPAPPAPPPIPAPAPAPIAATTPKPDPEPAGPRTVHVHEDDEEPVWQRWLPVGVIAGAGVVWLAIMAMTGQGQVDETSPPRVLDQAARVTATPAPQNGLVKPANADAARPVNPPAPGPGAQPSEQPSPRTPDATPETPALAPDTPAATTPVETVAGSPKPDSSAPAAADTATPSEPPEAQPALGANTAATTPDAAAPKPAQPEVGQTEPNQTEPEKTASTKTERPAPPAAKPDPTPASPAKPATPRPAPTTAALASTPTAPRTKPKTLTAAPSAPPRIKPASVNRSIERLEPRSVAARTEPRTVSQPQRSAASTSARPLGAYSTGRTSVRFAPLTAVELLQDAAAKGARTLSTPSATARFNADVKRALQSGADGSAQPLTTPDGRLLALRIISTNENQIRAMSIPRSPQVVKPSSRMVLEGGKYRTRAEVDLRAEPSEGTTLNLLARGVLLESIGTMGDSEWKLVGQQGRALGYVKADELQLATESIGGTSVSDAAKSVLFDIARVRTRCRNAEYAIDGGGSGAFTACRVHGGEWVLERGGELRALSPGRLVFKR